MPIYDKNESEKLVNHGMNSVWRDTARHRFVPTFKDGPTGKAEPYNAPYVALLAEGKTLVLEGEEQHALPVPRGSFEIVEKGVSDINLSAPTGHVLPLPLVDRILATSRLDRFEPKTNWYPSALRLKWAAYELGLATAANARGDRHTAACSLADVFGTLLPGFLVSKNPEAEGNRFVREELELFRRAWNGLALFVDETFFIKHLLSAFAGCTPEDKDISMFSLHRSCPYVYLVRSPGTPEFVEAERLTKLEESLRKFEEQIVEAGLPTVAGPRRDFELFNWKGVNKETGEGLHRFRIASEVLTVYRKTLLYKNRKSIRRVVWVFDRDDSNKLKLFDWPEQIRLDVMAKMRTGNSALRDITPDYSKDFIIHTTRRLYGEISRFVIQVNEAKNDTPFTAEERALLPMATRERLVHYFDGQFQALEELDRRHRDYERQVNKFFKVFAQSPTKE